MNALMFYRVSHWCYKHHLTFFSVLIFQFQFIVFHNYIHYKAEIGEGTFIPIKSTGVYIHPRAKIGKNCIIAHQVSIGGRSRQLGLPVIGDEVFIGVGAKIMGDLKIGDNVVIGVNAVVVKDVESGCAVGGVPAKVLKTGIRMRDFV